MVIVVWEGTSDESTIGAWEKCWSEDGENGGKEEERR